MRQRQLLSLEGKKKPQKKVLGIFTADFRVSLPFSGNDDIWWEGLLITSGLVTLWRGKKHRVWMNVFYITKRRPPILVSSVGRALGRLAQLNVFLKQNKKGWDKIFFKQNSRKWRNSPNTLINFSIWPKRKVKTRTMPHRCPPMSFGII
jgi:hypothetical protein